jgi:hypothetical protein
MGNMMDLGIWDECGHRHEDFMKIRRVLPCLAVVQLDSGAHALVGLDGGDELQEIYHVFTATPELEPLVDEKGSDEEFARWEAWYEVANEQMKLLSNSFNLEKSFAILSDALEVGYTMDEQFGFWFYNRIAAGVALLADDPVRGQYEYTTTHEQLAEAMTLEELSGAQGVSGSIDDVFVAPEGEDGK